MTHFENIASLYDAAIDRGAKHLHACKIAVHDVSEKINIAPTETQKNKLRENLKRLEQQIDILIKTTGEMTTTAANYRRRDRAQSSMNGLTLEQYYKARGYEPPTPGNYEVKY